MERRERVRAVDNRDGWRFEVRHYYAPDRVDTSRPPVLLIPGYGMNTFVLDWHPDDISMVQFLVEAGFEVFTANLRGQGNSSPIKGSGNFEFGFLEVARLDIPAVIAHVLKESIGDHEQLTGIGCSLGATYLHAYLALHPGEHRLQSMVSVGGPLRWVEQHPLMRFVFASERIAGIVPFKGTRAIAKKLLPVVRNVPPLLSLYMNARDIDLSQAAVLTNTVDDPIPSLNVEIARWVNGTDLTVGGVNVTSGVGDIAIPLLCIAANRDGIVPVATATSALDHWGGPGDKHIAGDKSRWFAHADLFINRRARVEVFEPLVDWLCGT
jgi:pimeloyl-ACP methyl ester carboxylesterase